MEEIESKGGESMCIFLFPLNCLKDSVRAIKWQPLELHDKFLGGKNPFGQDRMQLDSKALSLN